MKKLLIFALLPLVIFLATSIQTKNTLEISEGTSVWELLKALGEPAPNHELNPSMNDYSVEMGRVIVEDGVGAVKGKKIRLQSKHFVCTSCHNIKKEDPDLAKVDPQARLDYCAENGIPYLQGTTLYGAVNRSLFYNGDYEKKYGDLVKPTRNNLREAIQLCAVECSQGRRLNSTELESVLAYLWTIDLKLEDLNLTDAEYQKVQAHLKDDSKDHKEVITLLKSKYRQDSPATFVAPPADRKQGSGLTGDPANGKKFYETSCLHCHENERYSFFNLDNSKQSFCYLKGHFGKYSHASVYQVARWGTPPHPGKRAYMPQYTAEKMSEQQLADVRAYIESRAD